MAFICTFRAKPNGWRKGYMGHLTKIANHISCAVEDGPHKEELLKIWQQIPSDVITKWETFISTTIKDILNKKYSASAVSLC